MRLFGIKTGFNDAFYVDTPVRSQLVEKDPTCDPMIRKLLRGRTIRRWSPAWNGEWMIAIPSSSNRTWPWSESQNDNDAEEIFRQTYPSLHAHLKPFEQRLRHRQDRGTFWWELRACSYYDALEQSKIAVQQILYHSGFALDKENYWVNQKVYFIPTDDLYLLAILNSRVIWWYLYRIWPHMKDEALAVQKPHLLALPIPTASEAIRTQIVTLTQQAYELSQSETQLSQLLEIEWQLNDLINGIFDLSRKEIQTISCTLPPRDPLEVLARKVNRS